MNLQDYFPPWAMHNFPLELSCGCVAELDGNCVGGIHWLRQPEKCRLELVVEIEQRALELSVEGEPYCNQEEIPYDMAFEKHIGRGVMSAQ